MRRDVVKKKTKYYRREFFFREVSGVLAFQLCKDHEEGIKDSTKSPPSQV
jgi:hypothetical protein